MCEGLSREMHAIFSMFILLLHLRYENLISGRISRVRPPGAQVVVERLGGGGGEGASGPSTTSAEPKAESGKEAPARIDVGRPLIPLFEGAEEEGDEDDEERQAREEKEAAALLEQEASQSHCDYCRRVLLQPIRLARCRCALCACCYELTVRYMRECPACETTVDVKGGKPVSDASDGLLAKSEALASAGDPDMEEQKRLLQQLTEVRQNAQRIVLQYGNTSSGRGSKRSYTTFLKVVSAEGGAPEKGSVVKVDFNINPGYSKPTSTAKEPTDKSLGFVFESGLQFRKEGATNNHKETS